jgi:hypothetical protein
MNDIYKKKKYNKYLKTLVSEKNKKYLINFNNINNQQNIIIPTNKIIRSNDNINNKDINHDKCYETILLLEEYSNKLSDKNNEYINIIKNISNNIKNNNLSDFIKKFEKIQNVKYDENSKNF